MKFARALCMSLAIACSVSAGVILVDDLADGKTVAKPGNGGGKFVNGGWDSGSKGQLIFSFGKTIRHGGAQLWFTNVDLPKQCPNEKHEIWGGLGPKGHFAVRFGYPNYKNGFKILSSPSGRAATDPRKENRCMPGYNWGPKSDVVPMKITLKNNSLTVYLNGQKGATHDWGSQEYNLDRIVMGFMKYSGASGLVWVRAALWEGDEPANLNSLREGGAVEVRGPLTVLHAQKSAVDAQDAFVFDPLGRLIANEMNCCNAGVRILNSGEQWSIRFIRQK